MNDSRPILIIGGSGLLGEAISRELSRRETEFAAPPRTELDLLAPAELESALTGFNPRAVLNASAFTDVARAEFPEHREEVSRLNREVPGRLALICRRLGIPLLHVSTDYVFDGRKTEPYLENDAVAPLQVYGRSKLEGERAVREAHPGSLIVRTSTIFGPGRRKRPHYVDAVLRQAREKTRIELVRLPVSSPTYAPDLAVAMLELLQVGAAGIVHVANVGECSRLKLGRTAVQLAGLTDRVEVLERPQPPSDLDRPVYSVLGTGYYTRLTGREIRPWRDALREYVERHCS